MSGLVLGSLGCGSGIRLTLKSKEVTSHQKFKTKLDRYVHIGNEFFVLILIPIVEILYDLFKNHATAAHRLVKRNRNGRDRYDELFDE
jgi:hypothetical protein